MSKAPERWTPEQAQAMREMLDRHERERAEAARQAGGRPLATMRGDSCVPASWSEQMDRIEARQDELERQVAELVQMLAKEAK